MGAKLSHFVINLTGSSAVWEENVRSKVIRAFWLRFGGLVAAIFVCSAVSGGNELTERLILDGRDFSRQRRDSIILNWNIVISF